MVTAAQLRPGMIIRHEGIDFRVISSDYHAGQGKMGGVAHARLKNLTTGTFRELSFRSDLRLEVLEVARQHMQYLYSDADQCIFMNPESFDQIGIPRQVIGPAERFLKPEMTLPVEFVDGRPISVVFPDIVEIRVQNTAPPAHQQQDTTWKEAELENGLKVLVPQFIKIGDLLRIDVERLKYVDRAKGTPR